MGDEEDMRTATERAARAMSAAVQTVPNGGAMILIYLSPETQFGVCSWLAGDVPPPAGLQIAMLELAIRQVKDGKLRMEMVDFMPVQRPKGGV